MRRGGWAIVLLGLALLGRAANGAELVEALPPPAPPETRQTIEVCTDKAPPDCHPTIEAAIAAVPGGGLHIRVHCGVYPGTAVDLRGRSDIWIEGIPCADGALPRIEAQGNQGTTNNAWLEFSPYGGPPMRNLRVERLHITGPGYRKFGIRFDAAGPLVVDGVVIEKLGNGVFAAGPASGDIWVVNSRFSTNGHGEPGDNHHIYISCEKPDCRAFVYDSRFEGLFSASGRKCSNQIRFRAPVAVVARATFDARAGCVSRMVNTSEENRQLQIIDSVLIQGPTENGAMISTPEAEDPTPVVLLRNLVVISMRHGSGVLIDNLGRPDLRLHDVLMVRPAGCPGGFDRSCLFHRPAEAYLSPTTIENVRVSRRLADLPEELRNLLHGR